MPCQRRPQAASETPREDLFYQTYYSLSQQYPLILLLLVIVLGICVALIVTSFASGRVSTFGGTGRDVYGIRKKGLNRRPVTFSGIGAGCFAHFLMLKAGIDGVTDCKSRHVILPFLIHYVTKCQAKHHVGQTLGSGLDLACISLDLVADL